MNEIANAINNFPGIVPSLLLAGAGVLKPLRTTGEISACLAKDLLAQANA